MLNIDRGTESQFNLLIVKQRNTPRTTNWYYASCWVIGSRLAGTLTSRRSQRNSLDTDGRLDDYAKRATIRNQALPEMYQSGSRGSPGSQFVP
jgi:hypothetical protein